MKGLTAIFGIVGAFLLIGTAEACDLNTITLKQAFFQGLVGLVCLAIAKVNSCIVDYRKGERQ